MKITMAGDSYKKIVDVCGHITSDDLSRETLTYIQLLCLKNNICIATALDGTTLTQTQVHYDGDEGEMLIPVIKLKNKWPVEIEQDETVLTVTQNGLAQSQPAFHKEYINWPQIVSPRDTVYSIVFNKSVLEKVLKSFAKNDVVLLEFGSDVSPVIIRSTEVCALALPLRENTSAFARFPHPSELHGE